MRIISAEEWQLLSFFEVEPEMADPSVPWVYNDSVYVVTDGDITLSCAIHPAYRDVRLILKVQNKPVFELNAMGVSDVRYIKEKGKERLSILITERAEISLQVRPSIEISQRFEEVKE
jgi:hypothetical protein